MEKMKFVMFPYNESIDGEPMELSFNEWLSKSFVPLPVTRTLAGEVRGLDNSIADQLEFRRWILENATSSAPISIHVSCNAPIWAWRVLFEYTETREINSLGYGLARHFAEKQIFHQEQNQTT